MSTNILPGTEARQGPTRALLIGIEYPDNAPGEAEALLDELIELVHTLDIEIAETQLVHLKKANPRFLLGSGKAEALIKEAQKQGCTTIIFDDELTPSQQRNWETASGMRVADRNEIILDIFSSRAQTKEASLQVELARLEYMLPRLKRAWTHLHRQRGGGVTQRGDGETQLEMDQRIIRKRISKLKHELSEVVQHRSVQRQKRMRVPFPTGAIVGYTNAGKSSLLNRLTGAKALVENKLFATLDPKTRKLELETGQTLLLTDTVGFVRRLPHRLVEAFKATLEEAVVSDFLLHVIDGSSEDAEAHIATTNRVLKELEAYDKPTIIVLNKSDLDADPITVKTLLHAYPEAIQVSTKTGYGIDLLLERIDSLLTSTFTPQELLIPHDRYDIINTLHKAGAIKSEKPEADGVHIIANVPEHLESTLQPFRQSASKQHKIR